jgi:hypothetical protein
MSKEISTQEILRMIEDVQPEDIAKLDEIDARVECFLFSAKHEYVNHKDDLLMYKHCTTGKIEPFFVRGKYTRSRDALQRIRLDGWKFEIGHSTDGLDWMCEMEHLIQDKLIFSPHLPTEELAELHCIIQAIEYERGEK